MEHDKKQAGKQCRYLRGPAVVQERENGVRRSVEWKSQLRHMGASGRTVLFSNEGSTLHRWQRRRKP